MFLNCLKNKAIEYGKKLNEMKLGQSKYICECGQNIDRDLNAAINIKNLAVGMSV